MSSSNEAYLQAAKTIGHTICRDAIWFEDRCNWLTSGMEDHGSGYPRTYFKSLDSDLYSGTAGVAYFLSALYTAYPDSVIKATAYGAVRQALSTLSKIDVKLGMGFYVGRLGVVYSVIKAGQRFQDQDLVDLGISLLQDCLFLPLDQCGLDIIDGFAGAVPTLLNLFDDFEIDRLATWSVAIGDHLMKVKQNEAVGSSWETTPYKKNNLTGFANGAAGISNALFELYHFTGDEKYRAAGEEGFAYENFHFVSDEQNWPDFRSFNPTAEEASPKHQCACAWCHGAPGIGLARLRAYELTGDSQHKNDVLISIETTLRNNKPSQYANFSLCHGVFGNLDLLIEGNRIFDKAEWRSEIEVAADYGIKHHVNKGIPFINGVNNTYENPELMTGLSGMGYFYLRAYDAEQFPSILQVRPQVNRLDKDRSQLTLVTAGVVDGTRY